jgi:hypothetical protein
VAKRKASRKTSRREQVRSRAGGLCRYCRLSEEYEPIPFHVEHIISKKHHGTATLGNLAFSCSGCNLFKASNIAGIDPHTGRLTQLFHPRTDAWDEHFKWRGAVLMGKTAIGRTTVDVLNINHPERVRLRKLLIRLGELPPQTKR